MATLKETLRQIPKSPGVYIYKNALNEIIYVGKAKNLFNRVNSYFKGKKDPKTEALVNKISDIDFFITENETEALILENTLIKKHSPKYNIQLKDSKSYPFIKITGEPLPRIHKSREKLSPKSLYFGPFVNSELADTIITTLNSTLLLRKCRKHFHAPYNYTPCLNYHIGLCCAPCGSLISEADYQLRINSAVDFLKGNTSTLLKLLTAQMTDYSEKLNFEKAAIIRDQIKAIQNIKQDQVMELGSAENNDYIGIYKEYDTAAVSLILVRDGKVVDKRNFLFSNILQDDDFIENFLELFYLNCDFLPSRIFIKDEINNDTLLTDALIKKRGSRVKICAPETLRDKRLTRLAIDNAGIFYEEKKLKLDKIHHLRDLKKILNLTTIPRHIECFDIATLNGKFNTAAMSVFIDGEPDRASYRQFNIEGEGHPDDYAMMKEVIARRYQRLKIENKPFPDLIVVDGGKGQLSSAVEILDALNFDIPIIGIAKKEEEIFLRERKTPIKLPERSYALKLIQAIRDESHRFSNTRLSIRYKNDTLKTRLTEIPGIGPKKALRIQKEMGSIKKIAQMSVEDLSKIECIGAALAEKIYQYFH